MFEIAAKIFLSCFLSLLLTLITANLLSPNRNDTVLNAVVIVVYFVGMLAANIAVWSA